MELWDVSVIVGGNEANTNGDSNKERERGAEALNNDEERAEGERWARPK